MSVRKSVSYIFAVCAVLAPAVSGALTARADWGSIENITGNAQASTANVRQEGAISVVPLVGGRAAQGGDSNPTQFDAGTINLNSPLALAHTFTLINKSLSPVTITRIHPSCGCLSVSVDGKSVIGQTNEAGQLPSNFTPVTLAPGQELPVNVTLDPSTVAPGSLYKAVFVYANGADMPSIVLSIRGEASNGVSTGAQTLDFGAVKAGSASSRTFTLALDPVLLAGRPTPRLVSSSPDILIGAPLDAAGSRTYQVSISRTAALGSIFGSVTAIDPAHPRTTYASVPVSANVTGPLAASVAMIVFGAVPSGKGGAVDAALSGPASSGELTASSDNSDVSVRIRNGASPSVHAVLLPGTPAGLLHANVTIATATGLRLVLPVVADVVAK